jgi:hypothetical protein
MTIFPKKTGAALVSLAAAMCALGLAPAMTHAASAPAAAVALNPADAQGAALTGPGYFTLTAAPGSTTQLYAMVGNTGPIAGAIKVRAVDGTTASKGGISFAMPWSKRTGVGVWTHLSTGLVQLDASQAKLFPFTVTVPPKAAAGQYVGGFAAWVPAPRKSVNGSMGLKVQTRLVNAIVVTVPGRLRSAFTVLGASPVHLPFGTYVQVHVKNSGNTLLQGTGYVWVFRAGHKKPMISLPLQVDTTLPHRAISFPVFWGAAVQKGSYNYAVQMTWDGGSSVRHGHFRVK